MSDLTCPECGRTHTLPKEAPRYWCPECNARMQP